jgi:hypothetical protein
MPYTTINKSVSLMACSIVTITLWFLLMTSKSLIIPFVSWNIQKERKKNEFQTLTHFRIHLYYLSDFRPISGRNFPNEYSTDTSTLHVPLLVAFHWPVRRFLPFAWQERSSLFLLCSCVCWFNESIPFKTRHWYWCRITSWPPSQNKSEQG